MKASVLLFSFVLFISIHHPLLASVRYVNKSVSSTNNNGSSWRQAFTELQSALAVSSSGDQIWVAAGTYVPGTSSSDTFQLISGVAIYGGFSGGETLLTERNIDPATNGTILSGNLFGNNSVKSWHVVTGSNTDSTAILDGFTITAGSSGINGGGMYNYEGSPQITNCAFSNNYAKVSGGAIYNAKSSAILNNCSFSHNTAAEGGAITNTTNSAPTFTYCSFSNNSSNNSGGGAVHNYVSSPVFNHCSFSNNSSESRGGGAILDIGSVLTCHSCSFSNNSSASSGGAIYTTGNSTAQPSFSIIDCTFTENTSNNGGAIDSFNSGVPMPMNIMNCTFHKNYALIYGGAIRFTHSLAISSNVSNCVFSENSAMYYGGAFYTSPGSATVFTNNSFIGNSTAELEGGAVYLEGSPKFINCAFSGNAALKKDGGAVHHDNSTSSRNPYFLNCSFSGNSAVMGKGGAIHNSSPSTLSFDNCIIWNNKDMSGSASTASSISSLYSSYPVTYSNCLIQNYTANDLNASHTGGTGNLDGTGSSHAPRFTLPIDPGNAPTSFGNLRLLVGSPAINAGDGPSSTSVNTTTLDLAEGPRFVGTIDLGAYESSFNTFNTLFPDLDINGDDNRNGYSNYADYCMGLHPVASPTPNISPSIAGNRLTFSHRSEADDVIPIYQKSSNLSTWVPMQENVDYSVESTVMNGIRTDTTLTLLIDPATKKTMFFRQKISSSPEE